MRQKVVEATLENHEKQAGAACASWFESPHGVHARRTEGSMDVRIS